jgi:N,N'-diacetyl-8-epilegionaminate cytidylyltransferase
MSKRAFAFIFARGGSKGVPGKNIKLLAGKPLIAYAIETALATERFESVIVSTDSEEIAAISRKFGAATPFLRPGELASDTAPEWSAWRHAIQFVQDNYGAFDIFVSLPTTSPFRNVSDVRNCMSLLEENSETDIVLTGRRAERSPYFNMVRLDEKSFARLVIEPENNLVRRQDAPRVFDLTTVAYASRPYFILHADNVWAGKVRMAVIPEERAMDIDTNHDFFLAECIAREHPGVHLTEDK